MKFDLVIPAWNASGTISKLLESISLQELDDNVEIEVIVVDDCSTDDTYEIVKRYQNEGQLPIKVVTNRKNMGRAISCNNGISAGSGVAVLFIDADCLYRDGKSLMRLLRSYLSGHKVCFGSLAALNDDFWGMFFEQSQNKKNKKEYLTFSTTNMLCDRELLEAVGSFYSGYDHYGLEDRDLIARILKHIESDQSIGSVEDSCLVHDCSDSVVSYSQKFYLAGRYSSDIFFRRFPDQYKTMIYRFFDIKTTPAICRYILNLVSLFRRPIMWMAVNMDKPFGYRQKKLLVQLSSAISYYHGTKSLDWGSPNAGEN